MKNIVMKRISFPLFFFFSAQLLNSIAGNIIMPILPIYVRELGFSLADLGIASSALGVGLIIFEPIWGFLITKFKAKKMFLLSILCTPLIIFLYTLIRDLTSFLILRFLAGVVGSAVGVSSRILVRIFISKGERAFGSWYTIISMSGLIGPVIGGYIAIESYLLAFYVATIFAVIALLLTFGIAENKKDETSKEEAKLKMSRDEKIALLITSSLIILPIFLWSSYATFMPVFAKESEKFLLNPLEIGLVFSVMSIVGIFAPLLFGELSDKIGRKKIIMLGMLFLALSFIFLSIVTGFTMLCVTAAILALGYSAVGPTLMTLLADRIRPSNQGLAIGLYGAGEDLGILIGPLIIGYIYQNYSAELSFYFAAGSILINIVIAFLLL